MAIDRSEVAAAVAAILLIFAPVIHKSGLDSYVNLDLTSVTTLVAVAVGIGAYFLHRSNKSA